MLKIPQLRVTYSMRTSPLGRLLALIVLAKAVNRWSKRWSCWQLLTLVEATADALRTLRCFAWSEREKALGCSRRTQVAEGATPTPVRRHIGFVCPGLLHP
jgi:hypothetical protein